MKLMSLFFQQSTVISLAFTPAFKSSLACETTAPAISSSLSSKISPKSSDGVRVMTVHKSKGLEFAHVIVCDMMGKGRGDDSNFITEYSEKGEWIVKSKISGRENFDSDYASVLEQIKELEKQENINKIYVAFTRATKSLIIIKQAVPSGNSPSFFFILHKKRQERGKRLS